MPRNMSFMLTTTQVILGTKTVTRRKGWKNLKPGDLFWAVEKAMGLKKGEKVKRLALCRVVSNTRIPLNVLGWDDVRREGFAGWTPAQFVAFYCKHNKGAADQEVSRIEFEYIEGGEA